MQRNRSKKGKEKIGEVLFVSRERGILAWDTEERDATERERVAKEYPMHASLFLCFCLFIFPLFLQGEIYPPCSYSPLASLVVNENCSLAAGDYEIVGHLVVNGMYKKKEKKRKEKGREGGKGKGEKETTRFLEQADGIGLV